MLLAAVLIRLLPGLLTLMGLGHFHPNLATGAVLQHQAQSVGVLAEQLGRMLVLRPQYQMKRSLWRTGELRRHGAQVGRAEGDLHMLATVVQSLGQSLAQLGIHIGCRRGGVDLHLLTHFDRHVLHFLEHKGLPAAIDLHSLGVAFLLGSGSKAPAALHGIGVLLALRRGCHHLGLLNRSHICLLHRLLDRLDRLLLGLLLYRRLLNQRHGLNRHSFLLCRHHRDSRRLHVLQRQNGDRGLLRRHRHLYLSGHSLRQQSRAQRHQVRVQHGLLRLGILCLDGVLPILHRTLLGCTLGLVSVRLLVQLIPPLIQQILERGSALLAGRLRGGRVEVGQSPGALIDRLQQHIRHIHLLSPPFNGNYVPDQPLSICLVAETSSSMNCSSLFCISF